MVARYLPPPVDRADLLQLHDLDPALELMYFGWKAMTEEADAFLATVGLSRVHHRILYVIARKSDVT